MSAMHNARLVALDTETTGMPHHAGHRIIEIGCRQLQGRELADAFHCYVNPKRAVDQGAYKVHGLSDAFLHDKPIFAEVIDDLLAFIQGATLLIHNAPFDLGFLNMELARLGRSDTIEHHCDVIDTLVLARRLFPGQRRYSLDALCEQFSVASSHRTLHGALLDADLLAHVYKAMTAEQHALALDKPQDHCATTKNNQKGWRSIQGLVLQRASVSECAAHDAWVQAHEQSSNNS